MRRDYRSEILEYLRHINKGSNIALIVRALKINKLAAAKYLRQMEFEKFVFSEEITKTKKRWHSAMIDKMV